MKFSPDPRADRSQRALLDTAIDLLLVNPQASMSEIAKTAGVGRATLYRHFESRDALILELALESMRATEEVLAPIRSQSSSAKDQLSNGLVAIMQVADRYHFLLLLWHIASENKEILAIYQGQLDELSTLIEKAKTEKTISQTLATPWIVSLIDSLIYAGWWAVSQGELNAEQAGEHVVRVLFDGIG